ncbi:F-box protein [Melia azedarach]|uniref:F-box protein n=1 Tax=Melia azedarach TaxID=155640 RepID=A0ACC1X7D6_MELAZ|nr:F-box protein [Melia azedarach]
MLYKSGVFWNGAIHWINCHDTSLYFNVDEEQRGEMPIPSTAVPTAVPDDCKFGKRFRWFVKYSVDLDAITVSFLEMISGILSPAHQDYYRFSVL